MELKDSCNIPISPWSSPYIDNLVRDESCPLNGPFSNSRACEFPIPANNLFQIEEAGDRTELPGSHMADVVKAQIANHPRYHDLVSASIECQKVGAAPEVASFLEEICEENYQISGCSEIGANPELDEFMESYCKFLRRRKDKISKTFGEAAMFLSSMESQLIDLCKESSTRITIDHGSEVEAPEETNNQESAPGASEEALSCGEVEAPEETNNQESDVDGMLMSKYCGYISNLRREILKKRKKEKLPMDARTTLLEWGNGHYVWPYPTEEDKVKLSETTGLHQKQINNWFINQRKRHWKPSPDIMGFAHTMEGVSGSMHGPRADPHHGFGTE